jgi:hypothetical protein
MLSFIEQVTLSLAAIEHPRCSRCSMRMALIRSESRKDGFEKRTFGCAKCKFIETKMIADPLKSDAVARLANSMRPPS